MFSLETQILLNRFHCQAQLSELELSEKEKQPADEDGSAAAQKKKDSEAYLKHRLREIAEWERKLRGEKR